MKLFYFLKDFFFSIICAFLLAFLFQSFLYQPFKIPSSSMSPTLYIGDYILVEKFIYGYNNNSLSFMLNRIFFLNISIFFKSPTRGELVVFLLPNNNRFYYVKRLMGLPGDVLYIKNSIIYINDIPLIKIYFGSKLYFYYNNVKYRTDIYKEFLHISFSYFIFLDKIYKNITANFNPNSTPYYIIPHNYYFFIGDNRNNSIDSRYIKKIGYIPKNKIIGRAKFLLLNLNVSLLYFFSKLKFNRFFCNIS